MRRSYLQTTRISPRMRVAPARRGFVLVMTVVLIAVSGLMLVGMARQSMLIALEALQAQEDVQLRWARISCNDVLLRRAPQIMRQEEERLTQQDENTPRYASAISGNLPFGDLSIQITMADENAKVNLNTVHRRRGKREVSKCVGGLGGATGAFPVQLHPYRGDAARGLPAYDSWGQVYALHDSVSEASTPEALEAATTKITCWGDGQLHFRRASDAALAQVGKLVLGGGARRLIDLRREEPSASLDVVLKKMQLRERQLADLQSLLLNRSQCYSLWLHAAGARTTGSSLTIAEFRRNDRASLSSFAW